MRNLLILLTFFLLPFFSTAQEDIDLFQQFNGQYDFTALGNTLNLEENGGGGGCNILTESSADLNLSAGQTIQSALLYWAGSGAGDFDVNVSKGAANVSISSTRNFALNFQGRLFFGAFADITTFVTFNGTGTYTISNLDLQDALAQGEYCQTGTNFGGWSIIVIYEDLTLPLNQISVFDGFDFVANSNPQINFTLDNLDIASSDFAKIGFLAWEGDAGIANNETLRINGTIMDNALNPGNNAFNGTNSYTNSSDLYNMDLDFYDVDGVVDPGDTSVDIQLTSNQDLVIVHNVVTSVNSELPDATIVIDEIGILCDNGDLEVDYTVFNVNATEPLAAGIPIAFYVDDVLVGQSVTVTEIPIDGNESGSVVVNIPAPIPAIFTLTAVVDDDGTGTGILSENNEDNNEFDVIVQLSEISINIGEDITIVNGTAPCEGSTTTIETVIVSGTSYQWFVFDVITGTFVVIAGETGPDLTIGIPGEYRLEVVTSSGCIASDEIIVEFFPLPVPGIPDALTICDDDNDGVALFTLTDANAQIINGAPGVFVNYYETLAQADLGDITTALVSPYTNISNPQIVFARLENIAEGCFDTVALELIVFDTPVFIDPIPDFVLCDEDADGTTVFDLTSWDAQVTATPAGLIITYYEALVDAQGNVNEITPANAYTNTTTPQIIFVRIENADGCSAISQFNLIVNPLPVYTIPQDLSLCDYDGTLDESTEFDLSEVTTITTGDDPGFVVSYHESQIEAQAGTPIVPLLYTNTSNPQTIWTRIADAVTGCFIVDSFTLTVLDTPFANTPTSLKECDTDTDGIDEFDLTQADADIIGGQTDVFVNYYLTLALAEAGDPATALASPYTNITSPQTVYGRIEKTLTGCFDITELELVVILAEPLPTYELCDDDVADGITVFDLTQWDFQIAADPTGLVITYHETAASASAGVPFIDPANAYTNLSNPQGMFVRVVNTDGCVTIGTFDLFVNPLPLFNVPTLFELCDDAVADGLTEFDLSLKDLEITGGDPNLGVTYYLTLQDADAGTPELVLPYTNISNPQTVYPRISNLTTGCFDTTELDLFVNPLPIPFPPAALERCDNNADDVALFDLTLADADIVGDQTGVFVNYYLTLADAQLGDPATALLSPYANISNPQIVFARIEIAVTGCFDVTELELIVLPATDIGAFGTYELCDDPIADESTTFDLTTYDTIVVADPTGLTITYHETALDAAVGVGAIVPADAYNNITNPQTIFVRIEDIDECVEQGTFELFVIPRPLFDVPTPYALCEDDIADGFTQFDLTFNDAAILGGNPDYSLRGYYFSAALAEAGGLPLPDIYTNITNPQIIFVRVDDASTGCYGVQPLELQVIAPDAITPTTYNICDDLPNDGFATFDLTTKDVEITGGNPDYFVTYFETLADAQDVINPIVTPTAYDNTVQGFQIIYARVVDVLFPDCSSIVALELQVNDAPAITDPITDYFVCDLDGNGIETFDLTSKDDEILNSLVDVTLTYHESFADAEAGLFPITPATAYVSPSATIWVRAVNYEDGDISNDVLCVTIGQFDLILGETPAFNVIPEIEACDDEIADGITEFDLNSYNEIITGGNPDVTVTYHATQDFAQAGFPALPVFYTNTTNPEDIWVRVSDVSGCYGVFMSELVVVPRPEIFEPLPLIYCDDDNDGFGTFILTDADEQVVGGNPAGNLVVSYHVTLSDAINGVLPLVSPYDNEVPFDQIIYVRLFDIASGCYNTTILHLLVEERPAITDPQPLVVCDTDGDGIAVFNLTDAEPDILQGLTGGPYVVSYFTDVAMTSAIVNPFSFSNSVNPQTIYVMVSDTNNDCESFTTLELRVEIPPLLVNPTPIELCDQTDILGPDDELEIFDLTSRIAEITGDDLSVSVSFFESFADLQTNTNAIADPTAYQNIIGGVVQNPQTIWLRAEDVNTSCVVDTGAVTLDLIVNPLPSPITPTPLELCDIDNDGFGAFTLTDKDIEIIGGEPGVVISYHETLSDAENNIFPIGSPYQNIVADLQVIYVRATYDDVPPALGTGCWRVVELELIVNPTPIVPLDIAPIIACDPDMDGFEVFDLTQRAADIYGTQDVTQYALSYYISEVDAQGGTPSIASPSTFTNTVTPLQTIWIRLENTDSGCFKLGSFDIQVVDGPQVIQPDPFNKCDDLGEPFDGITTFDLTTQDAIITAGEPSIGVQYYETLANAQADIDAINPATAYVNQANLQTIYVRVTDGNSLCVDTSVTLTLRVLPNPQPEAPDPIALCDTDGDGQQVFDLTIRAAQILDGETYDLLYYETELLAIEGAAGTQIVDPTAYTNTSNPQDIYIRVTNPGSDALCFEIVVLTISVNSLPDDSVLLDDYEICELPFDGVSIFDLTTKIPEILVGQDMVNNVVSFYVTPADATAGVNPIPIPEVYQNISNPQAIYVGITNTATGCYVGGVQFFNIEVKPGATATAPALPYTLCDTQGENDGFTEFDLTLASLLDEILNGQDPLDYFVSFYETLANAMDAENPLGASYTNIINPQVIYARVENAASGCYDVVEVILKVNQLPVITLDDSYRLCVDQNGLPIASQEGASSPPVIDTGLDATLYSFEWSIDGVVQVGETGASIISTTGGVYQVSITQLASGCQTAVTTTVTVSQPPVEWSFNLTNGAFADNHTVEILAQGLGEYVYRIDNGPFQDSNVFTNVSPGVHTITIKDANGCGQVSFDIGVVDYPNYFTPNNDGYHDTWNIIGIADFDPEANIYIFDRYGKLLKQISPLTPGWDGTYNGNALPSSDYWFRVEYKEQGIQKEIRGHFTLKR